HAAEGHHHREGDGEQPHGGLTELRAPQTHRDHRDDVIETGDGMSQAAGEAERLPAARVRERRGRRDEHQREHPSAGSHRPNPKSMAVRWMVQNAPRDPTAYPGSISTQRGQRISSWRNERSSSRTRSTNETWPTSTPALKPSRASGSSLRGSPAPVS